MLYQLFDYDVLGNEEEGFEINDVYAHDLWVTLQGNESDKEIIQLIHNGDDIEIDHNCSDDETIEFVLRCNGKPVGRLSVLR